MSLLAARTEAIQRYQQQYPDLEDAEINSRLVAYCSDQVSRGGIPYKRKFSLQELIVRSKCFIYIFCYNIILLMIGIILALIHGAKSLYFTTTKYRLLQHAYVHEQAHSSVEKAGLIGLVKMRYISSDENLSMRGDSLLDAIKADREKGLIPFFVSIV